VGAALASHGRGHEIAPRQQRGSNSAGRAHTTHREANLLVLWYRPVKLGLVVGVVLWSLDGMSGAQGNRHYPVVLEWG
jgi:hypothetical protein